MPETEWMWTNIPREKLLEPGFSVPGVNIEVMVSPFDVPQAVRGFYDRTLGCFVIEFKYIADEPYRLYPMGGGTTLRVGRNSGRLLGFQIGVEGGSLIHLAIRNALERLAGKPVDSRRIRNYELAGEAVWQKEEPLLQEMAASR